MKIKLAKLALRISLIYAAAGIVWIVFSDRVLSALVSDSEVLARLEIYKGWAFVVVTAVLLYLLLRGHLWEWEREAVERKRAEEALKNNERFLRLVMDMVPHFIFVKDRKSRHLLVNRACADACKLTPDQMVGRSDLDLAPGNALAKSYMEDDQKVIASGRPKFVPEEMLTDAHGRTRYLQTTKIPFPSSAISFPVAGNGEPAILGVAVDITERRKAEDALRESHAQLMEALQIARLAYWEYDVANDKFLFNDQFYSILRTTAEQEGGYTMPSAEYAKRFVHPEDSAVVNTEIQKALAATNPSYKQQLDHRIIFRDGGVGYVSVHIRLQKDDQGRTVKTYGASMDITERKLAERARQMFRFSIDQASDAIFWLNDDGSFAYVNEQACRSLGYTREELMQLRLWKIDPVFPKERWNAEWEQFRKNKQGGNRQMETFHRRKDGSRFPVSISMKHLWFGGTELHIAVARDITERKQAEEKLVYEQVLFQTLLETTPDSIYFKDRESRFVRFSQSKVEDTLRTARDNFRALQPETNPDQWPSHLVGMEPFAAWLVGKTDFDTYPEAHARDAYEDEQEIIRTGRRLANKLEKATLPDGKSIWWLTTKLPWRDKDGNIIGTFGVSKDVTAIKQAEAALNQERLLLRAVIDNLPDFVYAKDKQGHFVLNNLVHAKALGAESPQAMRGKTDFDYFPRESAEQFFVDEQRIIETQEPILDQEQHYAAQSNGGDQRWYSISKVLWRDDGGNVLGTVGITRDITDRKRANEELRQLNRALKTLSKCNEALVRTMDEAGLLAKICQTVTETGGYQLAWVGFAEQDTNRSVRPVAWAGTQATYIKQLRVTWADNEHGRGPAGTAIRTGQPSFFTHLAERADFVPWQKEALSHGFDACIGLPLKADNKTFGVICVYSSRPDAFNATETALLKELADDLAFGITTLRNRAERKQLEEQLRQSQRMDAIGQLAGGVAHDFNNMLTVIQGNASLISNPQLNEAERSEGAQQIARAAERAASLTRQLLLFSRKQVMQAVPLNLNEVVANMTKMLQRILGEDISLNASFASNLPAILADPGMIEQILLNLAVNSRDAMPEGGRLNITTSAETLDKARAEKNPGASPGTYACLKVADTGCGIAPENLQRIFEPFFTTKKIGKGTGLGLATVYGIVQQHHGWLAVNSQIGEGTTFCIYLPATKDSLPKSPAASAVSRLPGGNETILLVEDEPPVRLLANNLLQRCGYTVLVAESGVAALPIWKKHREKIQLLLTDMVMPEGISGRELAETLRADRPDLKIIYTSGYSADIIGREPQLIDGSNFVQKPYHPLKLAQTIRNCLDQKPVS